MPAGIFPQDCPSRRHALKSSCLKQGCIKKAAPGTAFRFVPGGFHPGVLNQLFRVAYLGLLMSDFGLSDLSGVVAEATFRWFFTFRPPEFSFAMRSAASFASLLGTVPVRSTDLPAFTSTVTLALARLGSFWIAD